jgi:hypothetical protein
MILNLNNEELIINIRNFAEDIRIAPDEPEKGVRFILTVVGADLYNLEIVEKFVPYFVKDSISSIQVIEEDGRIIFNSSKYTRLDNIAMRMTTAEEYSEPYPNFVFTY